jgi:hypothetical protein
MRSIAYALIIVILIILIVDIWQQYLNETKKSILFDKKLQLVFIELKTQFNEPTEINANCAIWKFDKPFDFLGESSCKIKKITLCSEKFPIKIILKVELFYGFRNIIITDEAEQQKIKEILALSNENCITYNTFMKQINLKSTSWKSVEKLISNINKIAKLALLK